MWILAVVSVLIWMRWLSNGGLGFRVFGNEGGLFEVSAQILMSSEFLVTSVGQRSL